MENKIESISAFWKSNKMEVEQCSELVYGFLILLKEHNSTLFSHWYKKGRSKKDAMKNEIILEPLFFNNEINRNWDKLFHNLGARLSYWTGNIGPADISFQVGVYGDRPHHVNSCVLGLPEKCDFYENEQNRIKLIRLFKEYWKPDELLINGSKVNF